jgi:nicotinic acid mononucleotide adenylyltransferase
MKFASQSIGTPKSNEQKKAILEHRIAMCNELILNQQRAGIDSVKINKHIAKRDKFQESLDTVMAEM